MLPHATTALGHWLDARRRAGLMLVALDFDGTLAPIALRPELAELPDEARATLQRLAARPDTRVAVLSGRGLADVIRKVGVPGLYYAGNHGLEIHGPRLDRTQPLAAAAQPALRECLRRLRSSLAAIDGVVLEDKGLTSSVHYRLVDAPSDRETVRRLVHEACGGAAGLRITEGKMVVEVRPAVDWNKGRALEFLIDTLSGPGAAPFVIFMGDDVTDEDAFRALDGRGDGVVVADTPRADTAAGYQVESPADVVALLRSLADEEAG